MPAQIEGDDAVLQGKFLQLVLPLFGLPPKPMDEHDRPLRMVGRDIDRRKPDQRIRGNTDFMTIQIEVDVHEESLHEACVNVNFDPRD